MRAEDEIDSSAPSSGFSSVSQTDANSGCAAIGRHSKVPPNRLQGSEGKMDRRLFKINWYAVKEADRLGISRGYRGETMLHLSKNSSGGAQLTQLLSDGNHGIVHVCDREPCAAQVFLFPSYLFAF